MAGKCNAEKGRMHPASRPQKHPHHFTPPDIEERIKKAQERLKLGLPLHENKAELPRE